jgi:hypothetical protein
VRNPRHATHAVTRQPDTGIKNAAHHISRFAYIRCT